MALVRILVDGYSLLHQWPELAAGKPRHSEAARDELVQFLIRYQDASGTPVSVIFDGSFPHRSRPLHNSPKPVEVLFSRAGQTADDIIERVVHRMKDYGEVMVVTDDLVEAQAVFGLGGTPMSCAGFLQMADSALSDLDEDLKAYNQKQKRQFRAASSL